MTGEIRFPNGRLDYVSDRDEAAGKLFFSLYATDNNDGAATHLAVTVTVNAAGKTATAQQR